MVDLDEAQEILRRHRPVPWLARFIRLAKCRACVHRWPCWSVAVARGYIEDLDRRYPPQSGGWR